MEIELITSYDDLQKAAKVMQVLRHQYSLEELIVAMESQIKLGYKIAVVREGDTVLSVVGFWIQQKLAWKKHLYVDDLVTAKTARSKGTGKALLDWLKAYAKEQECKQMHLDSGVQRFDAHKFYLREGFKIASHHFSIEL